MNEDWNRKYLSGCTKEALIELYLQMRFERDLYMELYETKRNCEDCVCYNEIEAGCGFCCEKNMSVDAMMCCQHFKGEE